MRQKVSLKQFQEALQIIRMIKEFWTKLHQTSVNKPQKNKEKKVKAASEKSTD